MACINATIHQKTMILLVSLAMLSFAALITNPDIAAHGTSSSANLFATPSALQANEVGALMEMAVNISNVRDLWSMGFTITYNATLLKVEQVLQGTFFSPPPRSSFSFEINDTAGRVYVNMSLSSSENPLSGNGTLASIRFKAIQSSTTCISSPIRFQQSQLLDRDSNIIPHDTVGAVYFWKSLLPDPPEEGRLLDVYTQKGGEGLNQPDGEFLIGELVHLISRVTYNGYPVQQKLVAYQVLNPLNETVVIQTTITDPDGLAEISFRIPALPSSQGVWIAISVVDISGVVVWDIVTFEVLTGAPVGGYSTPVFSKIETRPSSAYLVCIAASILGIALLRRRH